MLVVHRIIPYIFYLSGISTFAGLFMMFIAYRNKNAKICNAGASILTAAICFEIASIFAMLLLGQRQLLNVWVLLADIVSGAMLVLCFIQINNECVRKARTGGERPERFVQCLALTTGLLGISFIILSLGQILIIAFCFGGALCGAIVSTLYASIIGYVLWNSYRVKQNEKPLQAQTMQPFVDLFEDLLKPRC